MDEKHNPPESMLDDHARKDWLLSSVGMLAVIFLITAAAFGWVFVSHQLGKESQLYPEPQPTGTSGTFSSTAEELKFRGTGGPSHLTGLTGTELTRVAELNSAPIGARVSLTNVTVERTEGSMFWVRDSDATIVVAVPGDLPTVKAGQHVNIIGTIESTGAGTRIRASRIDVR